MHTSRELIRLMNPFTFTTTTTDTLFHCTTTHICSTWQLSGDIILLTNSFTFTTTTTTTLFHCMTTYLFYMAASSRHNSSHEHIHPFHKYNSCSFPLYYYVHLFTWHISRELILLTNSFALTTTTTATLFHYITTYINPTQHFSENPFFSRTHSPLPKIFKLHLPLVSLYSTILHDTFLRHDSSHELSHLSQNFLMSHLSILTWPHFET